MIRSEQLRLATALAHTIPGVTLVLHCTGGDRLTVAHHRLDADLDPCRLRAAMVTSARPGLPRFVDSIEDVELRVGVEDLGGGLYRRRSEQGEERWFATLLDVAEVAALLDCCPLDVPDESMDASMMPDAELGATVVRIRPNEACDHPARTAQHDSVAAWAVGVCMVEELVRGHQSAARH